MSWVEPLKRAISKTLKYLTIHFCLSCSCDCYIPTNPTTYTTNFLLPLHLSIHLDQFSHPVLQGSMCLQNVRKYKVHCVVWKWSLNVNWPTTFPWAQWAVRAQSPLQCGSSATSDAGRNPFTFLPLRLSAGGWQVLISDERGRGLSEASCGAHLWRSVTLILVLVLITTAWFGLASRWRGTQPGTLGE